MQLTRLAVSIIFLALPLAFTPLPAPAQQLTPAPLEVRVGEAPEPMRALGRHHLVYELHVSHLGRRPIRLQRLDVVDSAGEPVARWEAEDLAERLVAIGESASDADPLRLLPGRRSIAFLWIALAPGRTPPASLQHRLLTTSDEEAGSFELKTRPVGVLADEFPLAEAPVAAGRWVALRGPSNASGHRRSVVVLGGVARVPQRFAVDWARLGDDGRLYRGDGARNEDWYGYGLPVLAARAGTVVGVIDGQAEHPPGPEAVAAWARTTNLSADTVAGNVVVVREGSERYAVYAHLRPGSIRVEPGDEVAAGQPLAEIGNSGHSLAPHLHFHVGNGPEPLAAEGLPFRLRRMRLIGKIDDPRTLIGGGAWSPDPGRPACRVEGETPLENMVIEVAERATGSTQTSPAPAAWSARPR